MTIPPAHVHKTIDRSHSFHQQLAIGQENGRLVQKISHIITRGPKTRESISPQKMRMLALSADCPVYTAPSATSRRQKAERDMEENSRLYQRISTMRSTPSLSRSVTEIPYRAHKEYIAKMKKTSFNFSM